MPMTLNIPDAESPIAASWTSSGATIDLTIDRAAARIVVDGELDISNASSLTSAFDAALGSGTCTIEVDLAGVTFIDSTSVAAILTFWPRAVECRVGITITEASPQVRRVIDMIELSGMGAFPA